MTVSVVVFGGVQLSPLSGTALGATALVCGVWVEATIVWLVARRVIRRDLPEVTPPGDVPITSMREFHRYYLPLAGTMVCFFLTSPIIAAGLTRGSSPTVSLASWPVAYSLVMLLASPMNGMQQVSVRFGAREQSAQVARRFIFGAGVALSATLLILNISGGTRWLVATAIGAPPDIVSSSLTLVWVISPLPLLSALRALSRGILIAEGRTAAVQTAILLNVFVLASIALVLVRFIDVRGFIVGGTALVLATAVEMVYLLRSTYRVAPVAADSSLASPV